MATVIGRKRDSQLARPYQDENVGSVLNSIIGSIADIRPVNTKASFQNVLAGTVDRKVGGKAGDKKKGVSKVKVVRASPNLPPKPTDVSSTKRTAVPSSIQNRKITRKRLVVKAAERPIVEEPIVEEPIAEESVPEPIKKTVVVKKTSPKKTSPKAKSPKKTSPKAKSPKISDGSIVAYSPRAKEPIQPFEIKHVELPQYKTSIPKIDKIAFPELREDTRLLKFTNNQLDALGKIDNRSDVDVVVKDNVQ